MPLELNPSRCCCWVLRGWGRQPCWGTRQDISRMIWKRESWSLIHPMR